MIARLLCTVFGHRRHRGQPLRCNRCGVYFIGRQS